MKTDQKILEEVNAADRIRDELVTRWPSLSQKQADGIADMLRADRLAVAEAGARTMRQMIVESLHRTALKTERARINAIRDLDAAAIARRAVDGDNA